MWSRKRALTKPDLSVEREKPWPLVARRILRILRLTVYITAADPKICKLEPRVCLELETGRRGAIREPPQFVGYQPNALKTLALILLLLDSYLGVRMAPALVTTMVLAALGVSSGRCSVKVVEG